jgi:hypothetical protein
MFWKSAPFPLSGNGGPLQTELFSKPGHQRNSNVLQYVPKNRSSPQVVTGKWLFKNFKSTTSLKNKNWTNPQLETTEKAMNSDKTRHNNPEF